jgi:hypothetical protein
MSTLSGGETAGRLGPVFAPARGMHTSQAVTLAAALLIGGCAASESLPPSGARVEPIGPAARPGGSVYDPGPAYPPSPGLPRSDYVIVQTPNGPVAVPRDQAGDVARRYGGRVYDPSDPQAPPAGRGSDAVGR